MEMTVILAALEEGLEQYKKTNNALAFIAALGRNGLRIAPIDPLEIEKRAEDDAHYTRMWEGVGQSGGRNNG